MSDTRPTDGPGDEAVSVRGRWIAAAVIVLATLVGGGVRLADLGGGGAWIDELYTLRDLSSENNYHSLTRWLGYQPTRLGLLAQGVTAEDIPFNRYWAYEDTGITLGKARVAACLIGILSHPPARVGRLAPAGAGRRGGDRGAHRRGHVERELVADRPLLYTGRALRRPGRAAVPRRDQDRQPLALRGVDRPRRPFLPVAPAGDLDRRGDAVRRGRAAGPSAAGELRQVGLVVGPGRDRGMHRDPGLRDGWAPNASARSPATSRRSSGRPRRACR